MKEIAVKIWETPKRYANFNNFFTCRYSNCELKKFNLRKGKEAKSKAMYDKVCTQTELDKVTETNIMIIIKKITLIRLPNTIKKETVLNFLRADKL